jgi:hypothetical protein
MAAAWLMEGHRPSMERRCLRRTTEVSMSIGQIVALVLEGVLGLFIAYAAWTPPSITKARDELHYPRWWWVLAGVMATIGAAGLLTGLVVPPGRGALVALWGCAYFAVAGISHLVRSDFRGFMYPLTFLIPCVILAVLRWADLGPALAFVGLE